MGIFLQCKQGERQSRPQSGDRRAVYADSPQAPAQRHGRQGVLGAASLSCAGYRHDRRTAFRIQQILSHSAIIYSAGGASAPPAFYLRHSACPSAAARKKAPFGAPSVRKVPQGGSCISIKFVSLKRCSLCGYAVFSLLRSVRWCWKASSISSGFSSWRMPTPL